MKIPAEIDEESSSIFFANSKVLQIAADVKKRSLEKLYSPFERLSLLTCGAVLLSDEILKAKGILEELDKTFESVPSKRPGENEEEKLAIDSKAECCDNEGGSKYNKGKQTHQDSDQTTTKSVSGENSSPSIVLSNGNSEDDGDEDKENQRRERKINKPHYDEIGFPQEVEDKGVPEGNTSGDVQMNYSSIPAKSSDEEMPPISVDEKRDLEGKSSGDVQINSASNPVKSSDEEIPPMSVDDKGDLEGNSSGDVKMNSASNPVKSSDEEESPMSVDEKRDLEGNSSGDMQMNSASNPVKSSDEEESPMSGDDKGDLEGNTSGDVQMNSASNPAKSSDEEMPPMSEENKRQHHCNLQDQKENQLLNASQCRTEKQGNVNKCRGNPCFYMHLLLQHSRECKYRVFGGCVQCSELCNVYLHHASHCNNPKCPILRCRQIRGHIRVAQPNLNKWRCEDDDVFFGDLNSSSLYSVVGIPSNNYNDSHQDADRSNRPITQQEVDDLIRKVSHRAVLPLNWQGNSLTYNSRGVLSRGIESNDTVSQRPEVTVLYPFNKTYLGLVNDRYDEGSEWRRCSPLGQGTYGKVDLCIDKKSSQLFAIKEIQKRKYNRHEIDVWSSISGHPNILEIFGAVSSNDSVILFMEFIEEGSAAHLLEHQPGKCFDEVTSLYILQESLEALNFLHSINIIYIDAKLQNLYVNYLLTKVKLGDFGSARKLNDSAVVQMNCVPGTPYSMAPEACRSEALSYSTDIWGFACMGIQLLTGELPFSMLPREAVIYKVGNGEKPKIPENCSRETQNMLDGMLEAKPSERPSAADLLKALQGFQSTQGPPMPDQAIFLD